MSLFEVVVAESLLDCEATLLCARAQAIVHTALVWWHLVACWMGDFYGILKSPAKSCNAVPCKPNRSLE